MRVVARHAAIAAVESPTNFCQWAREVAMAEGAEGWAAPVGEGVEVWFEGSAPAVEAMLEWCVSITESTDDGLEVTPQRPVLRGGFDVLEAPPTA